MAGHKVRRGEICIWGTFILVMFKAILGSFSTLVLKLPLTLKELTLEKNWLHWESVTLVKYKLGNWHYSIYCDFGGLFGAFFCQTWQCTYCFCQCYKAEHQGPWTSSWSLSPYWCTYCREMLLLEHFWITHLCVMHIHVANHMPWMICQRIHYSVNINCQQIKSLFISSHYKC